MPSVCRRCHPPPRGSRSPGVRGGLRARRSWAPGGGGGRRAREASRWVLPHRPPSAYRGCCCLLWRPSHAGNAAQSVIPRASLIYSKPRRGGEGGTPSPKPPPPHQTKVTIVGKNEIYRWEHLIGPFLVHRLLGPWPPLNRRPGPSLWQWGVEGAHHHI